MSDFQSFTEYAFSLVADFWLLISDYWWLAAMIILIILHSFLPDQAAKEERERTALNRSNRRRLK